MGQTQGRREAAAWAWIAGAAFSFLAASAFSLPGSAASAGPRLVYSAAAATSTQDWDLRDEQNRPIADAEARKALEAAALEAAYRSAFQPDQPTTRAFLANVEADLGGIFLRPELESARRVPDEALGKRWSKLGPSELGGSVGAAPDLSSTQAPARFEPEAGAYLRIPPVLLC